MERTERFYIIERLLRSQKSVSIQTFLRRLEVSPATFKRDIEYLRDRLEAPILWDRKLGGYRLAPGSTFELPGLWFNESEIYALLSMQHLLRNIESDLLAPLVQPLLARLRRLLTTKSASFSELEGRIRIIRGPARRPDLQFFERIATAVLTRKKLAIKHWNRARNEITERTVSPQRLVHYRANWYVDTWCHLRNDIRTLALDGIRSAVVLNESAKAISDRELDATLASGYGIFAGRDISWATLRFSPEQARYVRDEEWHPLQRHRTQDDGSYVLEVPYSNDRELLMDIMRYGADVEVLQPEALRSRVATAHLEAAQRNGNPN